MSVESVSAVDADLARVSAASAHLAAALAQEQPGSTANPSVVQRGHAAVQSAEAALEQAEAALHADQAASAIPAAATAPATIPATSHFVTDPGGLVA